MAINQLKPIFMKKDDQKNWLSFFSVTIYIKNDDSIINLEDLIKVKEVKLDKDLRMYEARLRSLISFIKSCKMI